MFGTSHRTVLGEPVGHRLVGGADETVQRHSAAGGGPERHGRPEHASSRARQQRRISIATRIGAEPLGEASGYSGLDLRHMRGLRRP